MVTIDTDPDVNDGAPTVAGTDVRVVDVAYDHEHLRYAPADIAKRRGHQLTEEAVREALSYYYAHIEELLPLDDVVTNEGHPVTNEDSPEPRKDPSPAEGRSTSDET